MKILYLRNSKDSYVNNIWPNDKWITSSSRGWVPDEQMPYLKKLIEQWETLYNKSFHEAKLKLYDIQIDGVIESGFDAIFPYDVREPIENNLNGNHNIVRLDGDDWLDFHKVVEFIDEKEDFNAWMWSVYFWKGYKFHLRKGYDSYNNNNKVNEMSHPKMETRWPDISISERWHNWILSNQYGMRMRNGYDNTHMLNEHAYFSKMIRENEFNIKITDDVFGLKIDNPTSISLLMQIGVKKTYKLFEGIKVDDINVNSKLLNYKLKRLQQFFDWLYNRKIKDNWLYYEK